MIEQSKINELWKTYFIEPIQMGSDCIYIRSEMKKITIMGINRRLELLEKFYKSAMGCDLPEEVIDATFNEIVELEKGEFNEVDYLPSRKNKIPSTQD